MEIIKLLLCTSGLVINTILDIKWKRISICTTIIYGIAGIVLQLIDQSLALSSVVALVPGLAALLLAKLTEEKIGYGDGIMLLAMGCNFSLSQLIYICMFGICMAGVFALILLIIFKKKKDYAIPFVPFLFWGYVLESCLC